MDVLSAFFTYGFLQNALLAAVLASVSCGISGTFVNINRITFVAGGIAHAVLGGVGAAVYFGWSPFGGAIVSSIVFAIILGLIKLKVSQHEDTVIGALWAGGMSAGIIFMYLTPGYSVNITSYLFGNILLVSDSDLIILSVLAVITLITALVFYRQFAFVSFDEEFARLRGIKSATIYIIMLTMIALTVVILMKVVGLVLVIAFLSLPAATAALFTKKIHLIIIVSGLINFFFSFTGLTFSYLYNLPTGATITLVSGVVFLILILWRQGYARISK